MLQLIWFSLIWLNAGLHPFFVSVTEIRSNDKTKTMEISCRIFYDDLERALEKDHPVQIDILQPTNRAQVDVFIQEYLKKQLQLTADGRPVDWRYLGYEIEEDAAWCYLEAPQKSFFKRLEVRNAILFEAHPTQQNMVHVTVGKQRLSTKLDNPDSRFVFNF